MEDRWCYSSDRVTDLQAPATFDEPPGSGRFVGCRIIQVTGVRLQ